jgi:hypothetical protein
MTVAGDVLLGCRLALGGGRHSRSRLAMTAVGVGLGVAVLLLASSVPGLLQTRDDRADARDIPYAGVESETEAPPSAALVLERRDSFRGRSFAGYVVQAGNAPIPRAPGVTRMPGPGEIVVSPAFGRLLSAPGSELLRPRYPQRVVGTIGSEGLLGPNELFFYAGTDDLAPDGLAVVAVEAFGPNAEVRSEPLNPLLLLLIVLGTASLLIPVVVFLATGTRLAAEARERRLAALRLVGADRDQVRRIAAGEAFVGGLAGIGAGVVLFLLGRQLTPLLTQSVFGSGFFAADIRPSWSLAILTVVAVPVLAVGIEIFSLRRTIVEPLGVVRRGRVVRRRLWWRLLPFVAGGGLLAIQIVARGGIQHSVTAGIVLMLLGVPLLLPWVVEHTVGRLGGGTPSWQLAVRRLQLDSATSARIVGGVAVALAGGIALQTMFIPAQNEFVHANPDYSRQIRVSAPVERPSQVEEFAGALRNVHGVEGQIAYARGSLVAAGDRYVPLYVASCATLRRLAHIARCTDGDVFRSIPPPDPNATDDAAPAVPPLPAGTRVWFDSSDLDPDRRADWTIPAAIRNVDARPDPVEVPSCESMPCAFTQGILATPAGLAGMRNQAFDLVASVMPAPSTVDAIEHVRNAIVPFGWSAGAIQPSEVHLDETYALVRPALVLGSLVTLLLAALSLLVIAVEQIKERRRPLAVLAASGVQRSVLAWSLLWQGLVPVVLAVVVALPAGFGLGTLLLMVSGKPLTYDWAGTAVLTAAGLGAVLVATMITLPALWRATGAEGLRTE